MALVTLRLGPAPSVAPAAAPSPAPGRMLIVCAPGSPGDTLLAQPLMDGFAAATARAAQWRPGSLGAIYFETESAGLARLAAPDAVLALVPLPFFLKHAAALNLEPRLEVETATGSTETWSLAAGRGLLNSPDGLAGWEVTGPAGYAPGFVRGPALGSWGALPGTARITFSPAVLSPLRRAAAGEKLAVLLDGAQSGALSSLPFAADLEVIVRSQPLPATLLCTIGLRLGRKEIDHLVEALLEMHRRPEDAEALRSIRIARFVPVDVPAIDAARRAFAAAIGG